MDFNEAILKHPESSPDKNNATPLCKKFQWILTIRKFSKQSMKLQGGTIQPEFKGQISKGLGIPHPGITAHHAAQQPCLKN